jgi:hypothetical protein
MKRNNRHQRQFSKGQGITIASSATDTPPMTDEEKWVEIGTMGLNASMGYVQEAYHADLQWPQVQPLYSRLRRSDPEVTTVRNVFQAMARAVKLQFVLGDDPTDDEKKAQEFGESVLEDMEGGADGFLSTLVSQVPFMGFGWWEVVPGLRKSNWVPPDEDDEWRSDYNDGMIGIRRLGWRDHSSFSRWDLNENTGKLKGMWQRDLPNPEKLIPLNRSVHVAFGDTHNPEGLSPLEAIWRLERIKFGLEIVQGIGFEHSAGYLSVKADKKLTNEDKNGIRAAALAITTAQEGNYATWPAGVNGELVDASFSAAPSILEAIKHFSVVKLMVFNMQWAALSTITGVGSNAAMTDSSQMFITVFNAMMDGMVAQIDQQLGRRLFWLNADRFPGMIKRPRLTCTAIEKQIALSDLATILDSLSWMAFSEDDLKEIRRATGILHPNIPAAEDIVRPGTTAQAPAAPAPAATEPTAEPPTNQQQLPHTVREWAQFKKQLNDANLALELRRATDMALGHK